MTKWILILSLWGVQAAWAGSFVGNGGNEGDVELAVTLMQMRESFRVIADHGDPTTLCTCNRQYERSSLCEPLRGLNEAQIRYCGESLKRQATRVSDLLSTPDQIRVRWTNSPIDVIENGRARAADAVANREVGEIVVNLSRFRSSRPAERVFLLSHEILHFTDLEGQPLTDKGAVGPFLGDDGSRTLVNAMAASAAVLQGAFPKEVKSYRAKLSRSQAWKSFWLDVNGGAAQHERETQNVYGFDRYARLGFVARYQLVHWGVFAGYRVQTADKKILDSIDAKEQVNIASLGASYRFFFSGDPLTFWGQNNLLVQAAIESVDAHYSANEDVAGAGVAIGDSDHARVFGGSIGAIYYIPLFWGLWTHLGLSYDVHSYKLDNFNFRYDQNTLSAYGGVSYAF